eukprot:TRINITY_DN81115_c0_g1_i1.p1 TRINITY_DN81115_c0_g1~~TRINITY_DN81115_c0_g1_i1.p1  ORF type:complete len:191 (-),score=54.09 TRINITY_DN81115_c0_g1_i1:149-721(-)
MIFPTADIVEQKPVMNLPSEVPAEDKVKCSYWERQASATSTTVPDASDHYQRLISAASNATDSGSTEEPFAGLRAEDMELSDEAKHLLAQDEHEDEEALLAAEFQSLEPAAIVKKITDSAIFSVLFHVLFLSLVLYHICVPGSLRSAMHGMVGLLQSMLVPLAALLFMPMAVFNIYVWAGRPDVLESGKA